MRWSEKDREREKGRGVKYRNESIFFCLAYLIPSVLEVEEQAAVLVLVLWIDILVEVV